MHELWKLMLGLLRVVYYILEGIVLVFVPKSLRKKDVAGETVLITGAGSGLGRLLALRFASLGARLVLCDIQPEGLKEVEKEVKALGAEVRRYVFDVSDRARVYEAAKLIKQDFGPVHILVNNAGIVTGRKLLECPDESVVKTFQVNALSHFWMLKAFLPDMIKSNHGHIVSMASMAGLCGTDKLTDYSASKFAAIGLEESVRLELFVDGHTGVHSTVVCPFYINTGMFAGVNTGRWFPVLDPEEVADEITTAVLINQEVLMMPKIFYLLIVLKSMVPTIAFKEFLSTVSICSSMSEFKGRAKEEEVS